MRVKNDEQRGESFVPEGSRCRSPVRGHPRNHASTAGDKELAFKHPGLPSWTQLHQSTRPFLALAPLLPAAVTLKKTEAAWRGGEGKQKNEEKEF